jgi:hypothetical protein
LEKQSGIGVGFGFGFGSHSLLHAVYNLLDKICMIASLQFRIFESYIRGLMKVLMSVAEVGLETFPSFVKFRSAVPCRDVSFETPSLVEDDIRLGDRLTCSQSLVGQIREVNIVLDGVENDVDGNWVLYIMLRSSLSRSSSICGETRP